MATDFSYVTLWQLSITLGLGLLVGLERERAGKEVGLRTFSFTALLGFLSWNLGPVYALATLAFVAVVVLVVNVSALQKGTGVEATTSVTLFTVAFVGMLVAQGALFTPVAVVILMLALLSWKEEMVLFSRLLQRHEIHAAITLGILAFVIYPVLPEGSLDPWGLFAPRQVWRMVVLISAISFANYVLLKLYGFKGITYTGFLGGLVNSTATAAELAGRSGAEDALFETSAFRGIMWAKTAAFLRNGLILGLFAPSALPAGILPVGLMIAVTLYLALRGRRSDESPPPEIRLESPFSLRSALGFGAMFAVITMIGGIAQQAAGDFGFYAVSFAAGIVSSSSTAATAANLVAVGSIDPVVAGSGVVLSSFASALTILPVVWRSSGGTGMTRRVARAVLWVILLGSVGIALNPFLLNNYAAIETLLAP